MELLEGFLLSNCTSLLSEIYKGFSSIYIEEIIHRVNEEYLNKIFIPLTCSNH